MRPNPVSRASNVSTATATAMRASCRAMALPAAPAVKNCVFHHSDEKWNTPTRRPAISPTTIRPRGQPQSLPEPLVMHPPPGRPEAERRPCHQQRSREKDPGSEGPVEPAAEEQAEQCRQNDRPAENANLPEPTPRARVRDLRDPLPRARQLFAQRAPGDPNRFPSRRGLPLYRGGRRRIGRRYRTSWRTARCMQADLLDTRLTVGFDLLRTDGRALSLRVLRASRRALLRGMRRQRCAPSETVNTPPRTAQKWVEPSAVRQRTTDGTSAVNRSAWPGNMPKLPLSSSARTAATSPLSTRICPGVVIVR